MAISTTSGVSGAQGECSGVGHAQDQRLDDELILGLHRRLTRWRTTTVLLAGLLVSALIGAGTYVWLADRSPSETSADVGFPRDMYVHHDQALRMAFLVRYRTDDVDVNTVAEDVIETQAQQQGMMLAWLRDNDVPATTSIAPMQWMAQGSAQGHDHDAADDLQDAAMADMAAEAVASGATATQAMESMGMASDDDLVALAQADDTEAEVLFLQLMTRHHVGGVEMAEAYLARGDEPALVDLADAMVVSQNRELSIMADLLTERGATVD